jgi:3D (Asp-Asp-Asp) domain-containing protein
MIQTCTRLWAAGAAAAALLVLSPGQASALSNKRRVVKTVVATAYCIGPCRQCGTRGRTFTGGSGRKGVAVSRLSSRRAVPLGSSVHVPGYGTARVDDVGGGVGGKQIDLRFTSHRRAVLWGRRKVRVTALVKPKK